MSEYKEYRDKKNRKNQHGNTDHRKQSSCMVAAPPVVVGIGLVVLSLRRLFR